MLFRVMFCSLFMTLDCRCTLSARHDYAVPQLCMLIQLKLFYAERPDLPDGSAYVVRFPVRFPIACPSPRYFRDPFLGCNIRARKNRLSTPCGASSRLIICRIRSFGTYRIIPRIPMLRPRRKRTFQRMPSSRPRRHSGDGTNRRTWCSSHC